MLCRVPGGEGRPVVRLPTKKYTDIDPTIAVNIEVNKYREEAAKVAGLVEKVKDLLAEQSARDRDARRAARNRP